MKAPYFSIVIPTLNEQEYLPDLLTDLSKQTFANFEVIVCDGYSEDQTKTRALSFSKKLKIRVIQSKIRNVAVQRNKGAQAATGEWIIFNDADNRLPKNFLADTAKMIAKKSSEVFTCWTVCHSDDPLAHVIITYLNMSSDVTRILGSGAALGALIGIRRQIFRSSPGFNPTVGYAEDTDFIRWLTKKGYHFDVFHKPTYIYSLRRVKKMGAMRFITETSKLYDKFIRNRPVNQKEEYPMGGHMFPKSPGNTKKQRTG
mgnify:CR=1 FL=1